MKESWQNLIDLIVNPRATFARLKSNPRWVMAFAAYCFLAIVLSWTTAPFTEHLLHQILSEDGTPIEPTELEQKSSFLVLMVPALIVSVISWLVLGAIFTIVARIFRLNKALKFKHIYAAFLHISLIRALIYLVNIGMIPVFRKMEDVETLIDLHVIPGLHMLIGASENIILLTFLSNVHLLSIWQIFIITVAVTVLAEINITKACVTGIVIWLLYVGIEVVFMVTSAT